MTWTLSENKSWAFLEKNYAWVADMRGVEQDPSYHTEGDVAEHTQRVLESLVSLPEYAELTPLEQEILWAAALLHDVEKRSTTKVDTDGKIISPGHAKRGELTVRKLLFKQIPTPLAIRESIAALVRYHGLPLWIMEKPDPQKALLLASLRVDTYLLAILAKADVLGRECSDADELLSRIELFELYCREQLCWRQPREFCSSEARFNYFASDSRDLNYQPYDDYKSRVTLLCGLPGMGKDRYLQYHYSALPVVSLDDIRRQLKIKPDDKMGTGRVVQQAKEQARMKLRVGEDFVWNATNITYQMRQQLISLFVSYNAWVRIVYLEVPYDRWRVQNNNREYAVPEKVLERMLSKLELPTPDEAHDVIYHTDY
ncbi:AAA family ATPase [Budvicia diplopodorum]|uniref:AAA family ATPase n=1 Tax=Budvicia diplopodorum TaxID=1119056 RepID=UPI0013574A8A|nr:AAA family ATPase [Budvicia diplopodorum]